MNPLVMGSKTIYKKNLMEKILTDLNYITFHQNFPFQWFPTVYIVNTGGLGQYFPHQVSQ